MRKEVSESVSWTVVIVVVLAALWVMWICPGIIAKIIITVAVIESLMSTIVEELKK